MYMYLKLLLLQVKFVFNNIHKLLVTSVYSSNNKILYLVNCSILSLFGWKSERRSFKDPGHYKCSSQYTPQGKQPPGDRGRILEYARRDRPSRIVDNESPQI